MADRKVRCTGADVANRGSNEYGSRWVKAAECARLDAPAGSDRLTVESIPCHRSDISARRCSHLATGTMANAIGTIGKNLRTPEKKKAA